MPAIVKRTNIQIARPVTGSNVRVEAEIKLDFLLAQKIGIPKLEAAVSLTREAMRLIIGKSIERAYNITTLAIRTKRLILSAVFNFDTAISFRFGKTTLDVVVEANWGGINIDYFLAQLFGRPDVNIPPHDFIILDSIALNEMKFVINEVGSNLQSQAKKEINKEKGKISGSSFYRASKFRARSNLRKKGILPDAAANFVDVQLAKGNTPAQIISSIDNPEIVLQIKQGIEVKIGD